jgi:NAD(P) transhydrogenase
VVERRQVVGGVSLHAGTIPSKTLREAVLYLTGNRESSFYGRSYPPGQAGIEDLMHRLEITLAHEIEVIRHQLTRNGVQVIYGTASFLDPHHIQVVNGLGDVSVLEAEKVLIATGTHPLHPQDIEFGDQGIIDSDAVPRMKRLPRTMTVVGAGVIGVEYASIFSAMDVEVILVDEHTTLLDFLDREIVDELLHSMRDRGVVLRLGERVTALEADGADGYAVTHLASGKRLRSELVLVTAGREGATDDLHLENTGLKVDERHRLKVDEHYRTAVPNIYAAGDVIGFPSLASTSMEQGRRAALHAFGHPITHKPEGFPFGLWTLPEISTVGLTEAELTGKNIPYEVGIARFRETARGQIAGITEGLLKLLFHLENRRLLGVHIIGEGATELVHIGQAVLSLDGTLDYFMDHVFNYPTLAEAYKAAALDARNRFPK